MISAAPVAIAQSHPRLSMPACATVRSSGRLGAAGSSYISAGIGAAGAGVGVALSTTAGAAALSTIGLTSAAIPFIGPIVSAAALIFSALGIGDGCGQSCITASNNANDFANKTTELTQSWTGLRNAQGGCLTSDQQTQYLAAFDALWQELVSVCTQIGGPGGKGCIADRQRGGKFDAFAVVRDPIANCPVCPISPATSATSTVAAALSPVAAALSPSWWPWLIPAGLAIAAAVME